MKAFKDWWIVQAVEKVYAFAYTEIGMLLSLLKTPDKSKYSSGRVAILALGANVLLSGIPAGNLHLFYDAAQLAAIAIIVIVLRLTKT
jgi:hypothetical protein